MLDRKKFKELLKYLDIDIYSIRKNNKLQIVDQLKNFERKDPATFYTFLNKKIFLNKTIDEVLIVLISQKIPYLNKTLMKRYRSYKYNAHKKGEDVILSLKEFELKLKKNRRIKRDNNKKASEKKSKDKEIRKVDKSSIKRDVNRNQMYLSDRFEESPIIILKKEKVIRIKKGDIVNKGKKKLKGKDWYEDMLKSKAWKNKRKVILKRDKYKCTKCSSVIRLQIHHLYYIKGRKPWEYPNKALVILCNECHTKIHTIQNIK